MPTVPIELQLADRLLVALRAMSVAGGYFFEPKFSSVSTDPVEILLVAESELPYLHVVFPDVAGGSRRFFPADQIKDGVPGMILARVDVGEDIPGAKLTAATQMSADLERALSIRNDTPAWHGGLAVDCRLARPQHSYGLGRDTKVIVQQPFVVSLYRSYGEP